MQSVKQPLQYLTCTLVSVIQTTTNNTIRDENYKKLNKQKNKNMLRFRS